MKLLVFGGTFNPIHEGHTHCIKALRDRFKDHEIMVIPNGGPPHKSKEELLSLEERGKMVELGVKGIKGVRVEYLEEEGKKNYTIDTILKIKQEEKAEKIKLVIGSDMYLSFHEWKEYRKLMEQVDLVVVVRKKEDIGKCKEYEKRRQIPMSILKTEVKEVSSTEIRENIKKGKFIYLEKEVEEYIRRHGKYGYRRKS